MFLASVSKGYTLKGNLKSNIDLLSAKEFKKTLTQFLKKTTI